MQYAVSLLTNGLAPDEASQVCRVLRHSQHSRGAIIFRAGEPAHMLFIVLEGVIKKTYSNARGDEQILGIYQRGEIFGQLFLGKYSHRIATAIAVTDVALAALARTDLEQLAAHIPRLSLNMIQHLADSQRETLARLHAVRQLNARFRLLGTLLTLARQSPSTEMEWHCLPLGVTQTDVAGIAGLNRTTASLLINQLRREGVLGGGGRRLTVHRERVESLLRAEGVEILE